jgi:Domain of unknown function (DUF3846)
MEELAMAAGKLVTISPHGTTTVTRIESVKGPSLEQLQRSIGGGYVERVRVRYNERVRDAYVDEDGIAKGLPLNAHATGMLAGMYRMAGGILGPMTIWVPDPQAHTRSRLTKAQRENIEKALSESNPPTVEELASYLEAAVRSIRGSPMAGWKQWVEHAESLLNRIGKETM